MKNKKGFTLIELLAIIVILAIIAVITVPIILNIIENSKRGAATDSAYGYKDAIDKFYVSKLSLDSAYNIPDGIHTKTDFDSMGVTSSGKQPANNSFLKTTKNKVTQGCLQFDEYKVEFLDGKPQQAEKGTCKQVDVMYVDVNNNGKIDKGDTVKIENDEFYVMAYPSEGKVKLLPKYNLNSSSRQASTDYISNWKFSELIYWTYWSGSSQYVESEYVNNNYYIYTRDDKNYLYSYFENYKNYLIELGATFVTDVRAVSKGDAEETGCTTSSNSCPDFMSNQDYYLGTCTSDRVYRIDNNGISAGYESWYYDGYRPLVEIYESAITNEYTITYNSRTETVIPNQKITVGSKIGTFPTNPTKTNATFEGWYTDPDYTTKVTTETVPIGSATYYARYVLSKAEYTDSNNSGTINTGDYVKIMDDEFYVMSAPSGGKVKLIPKYNLNSSSRQASTNYISNWKFSESIYWTYWSGSSQYVESEYANNNNYIYTRDDKNYLYYYFNNYQTYLTRQGAEFVTDVRAVSKGDAEETGCTTSSNSCPDFMSNQDYYLGTCTSDRVYRIDNNGISAGYESWYYDGYRPLVEISESAFPTN